ncbi:glycosyl hydrolase family 28-related protein [Propionibacteriaceae bacterium Y1685]
MIRNPSRRTVLKTAGVAALAGGLALGSGESVAAPRRATVNVRDHGAVGDGVTEDTVAFQSAIDAIADAGGGTLIIPPATYVLARANAVVLRADNMSVEATGATFTRPDAKNVPRAMFVANTRGTPGYGAGIRNLTWRGGKFVGSLAEGRFICLFGLHHAQDCLFEDITAENCQASGSHQFDLGAADGVTVRRCTFRGQDWTETAGAEAVQVDGSYRGTLTGGTEQAGFSGLMSRRITVEHCTFEPFTDADGKVWPGPTPMGCHFAVEGKYYEDIRFVHNVVREPRAAVLFGDHRDTWRGVVHFISVRGLEIAHNQFTMTAGRQTRVIAANSIGWGVVADADPEVGSPKADWAVPNATSDIVINNNVINGFTVEAGVDEMGAIVVLGMPGAEATGVSILSNTISGGYHPEAAQRAAGVEITNAHEVRVERNKIADYYAGVELATVSSSRVLSNQIQNHTGTPFPAAVVARDVTDTSIRPGRTVGYEAAVDRG